MATNKRTPDSPMADQASYEDASRYSRREYGGYSSRGAQTEEFADPSVAANANQYSRYNVGAYSSRIDPSVNERTAVTGAAERFKKLGAKRRGASSAKGRGRGADVNGAWASPGSAGPSAGSGHAGADGYSRGAYSGRSSRRKRKRVFRLVAILVAVLLFAGAASALAFSKAVNANLSEGLDPKLKQTLVPVMGEDDPFYMLLLGTDASLERKNDESYAEVFRTDTILLARIDPGQQKITLISMPRDTMVDMGENGTQKLNAAYAIGGASAAVEEVSDLAGVDISHFCLVDMDGLTSLVDALGGIEVDVPMEIDDVDAGGHLDAGVQTLNGEQALILCRSRNAFEEYGAGDLYRAANQRLVLQAIASKVLDSNPLSIARSVVAMSKYVSTDFTVRQIIDLALKFRGIDAQQSIYTDTMPTHSEYIDDLWYEIIDKDEWKTMMQRVDQGLPPRESSVIDEGSGVILSNTGDGAQKPEKAEGGDSDSSEADESSASASFDATVSVRNGTDVVGAASTAQALLQALGHNVADAADADATDYQQTLVVYSDESQAAQAQAIASSLGESAKAVLNDGTYSTNYEILVIIGADLASEIVA